ncbi:MAG: TRAP transporter substrate-binding protein DctP [Rhodospirillales bacterium]|nr:MAG: TRAP transporter substrate-binding protein DctP [Rhodospirillales bacterium]
MKRIALAVVAGIVTIGAYAANAAETVMRVSHQLPPKHHIAIKIADWAADIEARSGNTIDVQVFGANQAFDAKQNYPAVAKGDIEAAFSVNFQWGKTIPEMNVTLKPYSVTDIDVLRKWPNSEPAKYLDGLLLDKGVRNVVWLFTTNMSAFTSQGKALITPDDFKGVKIRGLNPLVDAGLKALGAAPSAMSGSKVYNALQTGVIDAGLTDISAAYSRKYYEVQDHVTVSPLFSVFFHGYVNPKWYDGLTAAQQQAITEASAAAAKAALDATEAAAAEAPGQLREKGMKVHIHSAAEIDAMKAIMDPAFSKAFDEATKGAGQKLLDMIAAM